MSADKAWHTQPIGLYHFADRGATNHEGTVTSYAGLCLSLPDTISAIPYVPYTSTTPETLCELNYGWHFTSSFSKTENKTRIRHTPLSTRRRGITGCVCYTLLEQSVVEFLLFGLATRGLLS